MITAVTGEREESKRRYVRGERARTIFLAKERSLRNSTSTIALTHCPPAILVDPLVLPRHATAQPEPPRLLLLPHQPGPQQRQRQLLRRERHPLTSAPRRLVILALRQVVAASVRHPPQ